MRVDTTAHKDVGLQKSLWLQLLEDLQVYNPRENMIAAKEKLKRFVREAISLDGGQIKSNFC
jgi:hypothetical protein